MKCNDCLVGITIQDEGDSGTYFGYMVEKQTPFIIDEKKLSTQCYHWFNYCPVCGKEIKYPKKFKEANDIIFIGCGTKHLLD